jgi:hypothetical protein
MDNVNSISGTGEEGVGFESQRYPEKKGSELGSDAG